MAAPPLAVAATGRRGAASRLRVIAGTPARPALLRVTGYFAPSASGCLEDLSVAYAARENDQSRCAKSGELCRRITDGENRAGSGGGRSLIVLEATPGIEPG